MFIETLMFHFQDQKKQSLTDLCNDIGLTYGVRVAKQSLDQRFNDSASAFFKRLLEKSISKLVNDNISLSIFEHFNKVRIKDSTSFGLPEKMHELYPGNSGYSSKSGITLQFEYDLKTYNITDIGVHSKKVNDYRNAHETISDISDGDLVIRDLGYVSIGLLKKIADRGAYFLNRIKPQTAIFEKIKGKYVRVSLRGIIKYLRKTEKQFIEKDLYIGDRKFLPCRVVFVKVPDDQLKERKKRQLKKSVRRGSNPDPKVLEATELNIFITNAPKEHIPTFEVYRVYRLRWQIELIFKTWKQICHINSIKSAKPSRIEAIIYAQLLWITVNWSVVVAFVAIHFRLGNGLLSIYKAFKTMKLVSHRFKGIMDNGEKLEILLETVGNLLSENHFKEKRKGKVFSVNIMDTFRG